jgi:hypothetical protein
VPIAICAAAYPFDMRPNASAPVWPIAGEFGVPLAWDPGFDGYEGVSLTDRWDGGGPLDSMAPEPSIAAALPTCVYDDGYVCLPLLLASVDCTAASAMSLVITGDTSPAVSTGLSLAIDMQGQQRGCAVDLVVGTTVKQAGVGVVVQGQQQRTVGLGVAISG